VNRAAPKSRHFSRLRSYICVYPGLVFLAILCLGWSLIALPAYYLLPARTGTRVGRFVISAGFGLFLGLVKWMGAFNFDLQELAELRQESGVILAPNHPQLIDALILLTCHRNMVCVMKTQLMKSVLLSAGSRLARFIGNTPPRRMIKQAVAALEDGGVLLLFPEGTRSVNAPINELQMSVGVIAKHAKCPVLTILIETDAPYLGKGWPLLRVPQLPITYRVRLGRRFDAPTDARQFTQELEAYFRQQLADSLQSQWLQCNAVNRGGYNDKP
jgi:1-acyl-sn-glycerol-3-phosphate acyltransferase